MPKVAAITFQCLGRELTVKYSQRDFRAVRSKQLPEGSQFFAAIGIWDTFSVARGRDSNAWTEKSVANALAAARALKEAIARDAELLAVNYAFRLPWERSWCKTNGGGFGMQGHIGYINAGPGELALKILARREDGTGEEVETLDLRPPGRYMTDSGGEIRVKREPSDFTFPFVLDEIVAFLAELPSATVRIRHYMAPA